MLEAGGPAALVFGATDDVPVRQALGEGRRLMGILLTVAITLGVPILGMLATSVFGIDYQAMFVAFPAASITLCICYLAAIVGVFFVCSIFKRRRASGSAGRKRTRQKRQ